MFIITVNQTSDIIESCLKGRASCRSGLNRNFNEIYREPSRREYIWARLAFSLEKIRLGQKRLQSLEFSAVQLVRDKFHVVNIARTNDSQSAPIRTKSQNEPILFYRF